MSERRRWMLLLLLPPLFWAGNALVGRATVGQVPPVGLSFWRWAVALVIILPFTWRSLVAALPVLKANWGAVLFLAVTSVTAYNTLLYLAVQTTTAINATLVASTMPLMIMIIARLWLKEAIRPAQLLGILVSGLGVAAVVSRGEPARLLALQFTPGDGLMQLATLSWAVYSLGLRRWRLPVDGLTLLTALIAVGLAVIFPLYLWELSTGARMAQGWQAPAAVLFTAVFPSLAAYYFWNRGVQAVGASVAGQFTYLIPLFTAIMAVAFLGEEFRWFHALGAGLIFAGIGLATLKVGRNP